MLKYGSDGSIGGFVPMTTRALQLVLCCLPLLVGTVVADVINVPSDYATIQAAVDASSNGDEIIVAPGTYTSTQDDHVVDTLGKAITLRSSGGPDVTIIDGQNARRGITCNNLETNATVIEGFTITNGTGSGSGGGIFCGNGNITITGCTISGNLANNVGGGIYCGFNSNPTIIGCTISGNTASNSGGGILCADISNPTITDCTISGNTAYYGGGIWCADNSSPTITGCMISGNAADDGGGIRCNNSSPTITGCTISGNTADYGGGIFCNYNSNPTITGCTNLG